ncbi:MAG: hypothetical protein ACYCT1_03215 [Steroidobacteraceae bacterium]
MSEELQRALRQALRVEDPGRAFTERVMARVADEPTASGVRGWLARVCSTLRPGSPRAAAPWLAAGATACVLAVLGVAHWRSESLARARGLQARAELLQALSITAETVGTARRLVLRNERPDS